MRNRHCDKVPGRGEKNKNTSGACGGIDGNQEKRMPRERIYLFMSVVVVPLVLFLSVEAGLRVAGYGYPTGFMTRCGKFNKGAYCENKDFPKRFFPPGLARPPVPFLIREGPSEKTYRIFVLGGSAAQGDPEHTFGFSRILEVMLAEKYQGINFEIVNTAMTAINSHVVLEITGDIIEHNPDLLIVYLGNNEVVGPFGAGTVLTPFLPDLSLIRARIMIEKTRLGQAVIRLIKLAGGTGNRPPGEWQGMEMFLGKKIRNDAPQMKQVYQNFRDNLTDIIDRANNRGVNIMISTVGVNLKDSGPFASLHGRGVTGVEKKRWEEIYMEGVELENARRYPEALSSYSEAEVIDGQYAELHYRMGRIYMKTGDHEKAAGKFAAARELDVLRFRADKEINSIIRSVAGGREQEGVFLLDSEINLKASSSEGITGDELFHDHVHMNFSGNYVIAEGMLLKLASVLPEWVKETETAGRALSMDETAKRLALTDFDKYRINKEMLRRFRRAPFTNQLGSRERREELKRGLEKLKDGSMPEAELAYKTATAKRGDDPWLFYNYALLQSTVGNHVRSAGLFRRFLDYLPQHAPAREMLASELIHQGEFDLAVEQCRAALEIDPGFYKAGYTLAYAFAQKGELEKSIEEYRKLLGSDTSTTVDIYNEIGILNVRLGRLDDAADNFMEAIEFNRESGMNRNISDVHFNLGYVMKESGEYGKAAEQFAKAVKMSPRSLRYHLNLIKVYEEQGLDAKAAEKADEALRIMNENGNMEGVKRIREYLGSRERGVKD